MLDDKIVVMDESRKWILQTLESLRAFQIELYDLVQAEYHLVNEHKLACDNAHNDTLSEADRSAAYNDSVNLRQQMNKALDDVLSKYSNLSF